MSPPVQRDGKPVKKLNRRESSCVPLLLCVAMRARPIIAMLLTVAWASEPVRYLLS
jgi:hypothetical protein